MKVLQSRSFVRYTHLRVLYIRNFTQLVTLEAGVFDGLSELRTLIITECLSLHTIGPGVFGTFMNLDTLRINKCGLTSIPDFSMFGTKSESQNNSMYEIDLSSNKIDRIRGADFSQVETFILVLENNMLKRIEDKAFSGATIKKLICKNNMNLYHLGKHAFSGIQELDVLDLSRSQISNLPTEGLINIQVLILEDTPTLKQFPSVFKFSRIHTAKLTYPHHCCAFSHANMQDPKESSNSESFEREGACGTQMTSPHSMESTLTSTSYAPPVRFRLKRDESGFKRFAARLSLSSMSQNSGMDDDIKRTGKSEETIGFVPFDLVTPGPLGDYNQFVGPILTPPSVIPTSKDQSNWHDEPTTHNETRWVSCGNFSSYKDYSEVVCTPRPNAFNPCEDVMGYEWLRVLVWFVLLAALCGNLVVMIVLSTARSKLTVPKFLMCNLSFADFLMGFYLLLIASVDVHSLGEYFTHAVSWQNDGGCQIAGFLTVFSSELSVFVLTVITLERWYAISQAIHVNKRLRMKQAAVLMFIGWLYASCMAILPLTGVSGYGAVSMCLPMEAKDVWDIVYIIALLVFNGVAFVAICGCYISMYLQVRASENMARSNDATIAKRMAILVLTNFICWAPIAFFGLTASFGLPLIDITKSKILLVFFYPFNSCANPFLYAILTKQFRRDVFILLGRHGICTDRANKYKGTSITRSYSNSRNNGLVLNTVNNATDISILSQYQRSKNSISIGNVSSTNCSAPQTPKATPSCTPQGTPTQSPKSGNDILKPSFLSALKNAMESQSSSPVKPERKLSTVVETTHVPDSRAEGSDSRVASNKNEKVLEQKDSIGDLFDDNPHSRVRSASEYVVIFRNNNYSQNPKTHQQQNHENEKSTSDRGGSFQRQASRDTVLSSNTLSSFLSDSGSSRMDSDSELRMSERRSSPANLMTISGDRRQSDGTYFAGRKDYCLTSDAESASEAESLLESSNQRKDSFPDYDYGCRYDGISMKIPGRPAGEVIMEHFNEEDEEVEINQDELPSETDKFENESQSAQVNRTVKPMWFSSKNSSGQNRKVSFCDENAKSNSNNTKKESKLRYSFLRKK